MFEHAKVGEFDPRRRALGRDHFGGERRHFDADELTLFLIAREALEVERATVGRPFETPEVFFLARAGHAHVRRFPRREVDEADANDRVLASGDGITLHHEVAVAVAVAEDGHLFDGSLVDFEEHDAVALRRPKKSVPLVELFLSVEIGEPACDAGGSSLRYRELFFRRDLDGEKLALADEGDALAGVAGPRIQLGFGRFGEAQDRSVVAMREHVAGERDHQEGRPLRPAVRGDSLVVPSLALASTLFLPLPRRLPR